jgi:hypothetical protein
VGSSHPEAGAEGGERLGVEDRETILACQRALVPNLDDLSTTEVIYWRTGSVEERRSWERTLRDIWAYGAVS